VISNISIIIPTYNRAETLKKTLQAYASQTGQHEILEVLLVDDGSKDHTQAAVAEFLSNYPVSLRYLRQEKKGIPAARNYGIREARGNVILFGDDDIIPAPNLVAQHADWHRRNPGENVGVLGYVAFAPEVRPTPFMVWANQYGPQFAYAYLTPGAEVEYRCAGFWNTSLKTDFLRRNGIFDESFRRFGWEDLELSYRLHQRGYRVLYNSAAVGYHYKFETFANTCSRIKLTWDSFPVFATTDAGKNYLALLNEHRFSSRRQSIPFFRKLARLLKPIAIPVLRPLLDTRIPLPDSVYDAMWYYYSSPIIDHAIHSWERLEP
jgi:glycosyltransferase involved in cell wall biosynthesis